MTSCVARAGLLLSTLLLLSGSTQAKESRPKLFLSCPQTCFEPYMRQELSYFDIVRDRHLSDITLLVVRQRAANGGERFAVSGVRPGDGAAVPVARTLSTRPAAPAEEVREQLRDVILRVLYSSLQSTPHAHVFQLALPRRDGSALSQLDDPWDYWTVSPELIGNAAAQSGFHYAVLTSALTLRRTTELNKLRLRGSYTRQFNRVRLSDRSEADGDWFAWDGRVIYARSVGERWAIGFASTERANQLENLRAHLHGGPVVELNLFPYSQNVSKQIRIAYQAGPWMSWYFEETASGKHHEARPYHALSVVADVNQRWGSVQWAVQLTSLLDEPGRYRLGSTALASLQLFQGFAVTLQGMGAVVRDQINLRARPLTDIELLLGTAEQSTNFHLELEFGLVYTFGSIHNTIVNPRFGRLDLQEE
jgi:hypothetical protein